MFSVVSPQRGGDMTEYLASLGRMEKLRLSRLAPGHGDVIEDPDRGSRSTWPTATTGRSRCWPC